MIVLTVLARRQLQGAVDRFRRLRAGGPLYGWPPCHITDARAGRRRVGTPKLGPVDMDPLLWTPFVRIEPFSKGECPDPREVSQCQ